MLGDEDHEASIYDIRTMAAQFLMIINQQLFSTYTVQHGKRWETRYDMGSSSTVQSKN